MILFSIAKLQIKLLDQVLGGTYVFQVAFSLTQTLLRKHIAKLSALEFLQGNNI